MITKPTISYHCARAFALAELLDVAYAQAYDALDQCTDKPESVLDRVKNLLHVAEECASNLATDLSDLIADAEPDTPNEPTACAASDDLYSLGLTAFTTRTLCGHGISTIRKLTSLTFLDLLKLPNVGQKSLNEIKEKLSEKGLSLARGEAS